MKIQQPSNYHSYSFLQFTQQVKSILIQWHK